MNKLLEFESINNFEVRGHQCYGVKNGQECANFDHITGKTVLIDGVSVKVVGVERFAHSPPWRAGENIALMCE